MFSEDETASHVIQYNAATTIGEERKSITLDSLLQEKKYKKNQT